jgi:predicted dehydrogenase
MKTIRWGIIGCGDVTEIKSGPAFQKSSHSELMAVMRRDTHKAEDYARRHNVPKWYDDADKLIQDPQVDAVYIATPPDTHLFYTLRVAAAGKPVYVEKPMARSYKECRQMIDVCKKNKVPLFVAYYRRSLPRFLKIKELLDKQTIGQIRTVSVRLFLPVRKTDYTANNLPWRVITKIAGGGLFFDLASHTLDILDYYFGPVLKALGLAANQMNLYKSEDVVSASFIFENGIVGNGLWCFNSENDEDLIEIKGENGRITISTFSHSPLRLSIKGAEKTWEIAHPPHIQQPHIQSIIDELNGKGRCPCHGEDGARTARVMDSIIEDWRNVNKIKFE